MEVTANLVDSVYEYINADDPPLDDFSGLMCDEKVIKKYLEIRASALSVFGLKKKDEIQAALGDLDKLGRYGLKELKEASSRLNPDYTIHRMDVSLYQCVSYALLLSLNDEKIPSPPVLSEDLKDEQYTMLCVIMELIICGNRFSLARLDKEKEAKHTIDAISSLLFINEEFEEINDRMILNSVKDAWHSQYESELQDHKIMSQKYINFLEDRYAKKCINNAKKGVITHRSMWGVSIDFCITEASNIWKNQKECNLDISRMSEMCNSLRSSLGSNNLQQPDNIETIKKWLNKAEKDGKLAIPKEARKSGRPSVR